MDTSNRRLVSFARENRAPATIVNAIGRSRSQKLLPYLQSWLPKSGRVLDIGVGSAHMAEAVETGERKVIGVDITDMRFVPMSLVYGDGAQLPFADGSFQAAMLLTVLHHIPSPAHVPVLQEAMRVLKRGGRLLLLEDTYHSKLERRFTLFLDTMMNAEFSGHPHANRHLSEWQDLIASLDLKTIHAEEFFVWYGLFRIRHALIVIEQTGSQ
jgi:ubiquinone/menaquinone biosynthesis C-methylase UbiE